MTRLPDWLERLTLYLDGVVARPYDPVAHNCATFILDVVHAVTGETPLEVLARIKLELPDTEFGVARLLAERGGMRGIAIETFGELNEFVMQARRGDIALFNTGHGETLGVVENNGALCVTPEGLWRFDLKGSMGFWRLG